MNTVYLTNARTLWDENYLGYTPQGFGWDDKLAGAQILLARLYFTCKKKQELMITICLTRIHNKKVCWSLGAGICDSC